MIYLLDTWIQRCLQTSSVLNASKIVYLNSGKQKRKHSKHVNIYTKILILPEKNWFYMLTMLGNYLQFLLKIIVQISCFSNQLDSTKWKN